MQQDDSPKTPKRPQLPNPLETWVKPRMQEALEGKPVGPDPLEKWVRQRIQESLEGRPAQRDPTRSTPEPIPFDSPEAYEAWEADQRKPSRQQKRKYTPEERQRMAQFLRLIRRSKWDKTVIYRT